MKIFNRLIRKYNFLRIKANLETVDRACPVCQDTGFRVLYQKDKLKLNLNTVECKNCGLWFTNPAPTSDFLNKFYGSSMYRGVYSGILGATKDNVGEQDILSKKHLAYLKYLVSEKIIIPPKTLLDFGSSSGAFLMEIRNWSKGVKITGIEPGSNFSRVHSHELDIYPNLAAVPNESNFDIITAWHVVEHLLDPLAQLSALKQTLSPGGVLIMEVPNKDYYNRGIKHIHLAHVSHFSKSTIYLLAEKLNMRVLDVNRETDFLIDSTGMNFVLANN